VDIKKKLQDHFSTNTEESKINKTSH